MNHVAQSPIVHQVSYIGVQFLYTIKRCIHNDLNMIKRDRSVTQLE